MKRMGILRKTAGAAAAALALSTFPSCGFVQQEPLRADVGALDSIGVEELGFRKGRTGIIEAERTMKSRGLTGITKAEISAHGRNIHVLAADYQSKLHVFERDVYQESVWLHSGSVPPYGFALALASSKSRTHLLALYRDPLDMVPSEGRGMAAEPPRIEAFALDGGSFRYAGTLRLARMSKANGGLTDPLFVGSDLDAGILFIARSARGAVWQKAYLLGMKAGDGSQPHLGIIGSVSRDDAAGCSCISDYIYGESDE